MSKFNEYLEAVNKVSRDGVNWVKPKKAKKQPAVECPSCGYKIPATEVNDYGQKRCKQCGVLVGGNTK